LRGASRGRRLPGQEVPGGALLEALLPAREPRDGARRHPLRAAVAARWPALRRRPRHRHHGRLSRRPLCGAGVRARRPAAAVRGGVDGERDLLRARDVAVSPRADLGHGGARNGPPKPPTFGAPRPRPGGPPTPPLRPPPPPRGRPPRTSPPP